MEKIFCGPSSMNDLIAKFDIDNLKLVYLYPFFPSLRFELMTYIITLPLLFRPMTYHVPFKNLDNTKTCIF